MTRPEMDRNIFKCRNGEVITVKVAAVITRLLVNYVINDNPVNPAPGQDLTFTMDDADNKNVQLTLALTFAQPAGKTGKYTVKISGDPGGVVFTRDYAGAFGVPVKVIPFFFDVD